jgi:hypothetical protein
MAFKCNIEKKELTIAAMTGVLRYIENVYGETSDRYGAERDWSMDITAAIGEMAVARLLNEYWSPGTPRSADLARHNLEVRSTSWWHGSLILHPDDADEHPFILVTIRGAEARIAGWCFGIEGKRKEYWSVERQRALRHPCFMVPQERLSPVEELLALLRENAVASVYDVRAYELEKEKCG